MYRRLFAANPAPHRSALADVLDNMSVLAESWRRYNGRPTPHEPSAEHQPTPPIDLTCRARGAAAGCRRLITPRNQRRRPKARRHGAG